MAGGKVAVVEGPNGSGKTTLLRALAGFLLPAAGRISLESAGEERDLPEQVHYLGHRDGLRAALTATENLAFAARLLGDAGLSPSEALGRVGLTRIADLPVGVLSAGQRRRVALARLLVARRPVWLLDEPTSALDTAAQATVAGLIRDHAAQGGLVVAATHLDLGVRDGTIRLGGS